MGDRDVSPFKAHLASLEQTAIIQGHADPQQSLASDSARQRYTVLFNVPCGDGIAE